MSRLTTLAIAALLAALTCSCDKPSSAPPPAPAGTDAWPEAPSGPLWEGLGRLPVAVRGEVGVVEASAALASHAPYAEVLHDKYARQAEALLVTRMQLPPTHMKEVVWAEYPDNRGDLGTLYLLVRVTTPVERLRASLKAIAYEQIPGEEDLWRPANPTSNQPPDRILLREGWLVRTPQGEPAIERLLRAWSGTEPSLLTLPTLRTVLAGLPQSLPAAVRFGINDAPLANSPLRVITQALAPDPTTGEDIVVVAFNNDKGPEIMLASDTWKEIQRRQPPPRADRQGACLRVRSRRPPKSELDSELGVQTRLELLAIRSAVESYRADKGLYPKSLADLMQGDPPYYAGHGQDAWKRMIIYRAPGRNGREYDLRSPGADSQLGTADDIELER